MSKFYTPLRYPGGKQKLAPFIREVLAENDLTGGCYVEPYAGGSGVAIDLLITGEVSNIYLNDSCKGIYAFWRSVLRAPDDLCRRISRAVLTVNEWQRQREIFLHPSGHSLLELGFATFYLNRCNRSGILCGGLIGGLGQKGKWKMDARFTKKNLIARIEMIAEYSRFITVTNKDAVDYISHNIPKLPRKCLVYFDPPYYRKANRLYPNYYQESDHEDIANVIQKKVARRWLVSYDSCAEIARFYRGRRQFVYNLQYNAAIAYKGKELIIASDNLKLPGDSAVPSISTVLNAKTRRFLASRLSSVSASQSNRRSTASYLRI